MAKYQITYTCGHTADVYIYGPLTKRQQRRDALETRICPDCIIAEKAEVARAAGLAGTNKQVVWAYDIRSKAEDVIKHIRGKINTLADKNERNIALLDEIIADYLSEADAVYWISNRETVLNEDKVIMMLFNILRSKV